MPCGSWLMAAAGSQAAVGIAAALGSPAVGTLGFVFYESWTRSASALNTLKGLAAGAVFCTLSLSTGARARFAGRAGDLVYLVLSAFVGITLGDTAWLHSLQLLGARRVVLLDSLKPFVAWILGALFLKQRHMTARGGVGLALTVAGVLLVALKGDDNGGGGSSGDSEKPQTRSRRLRQGYVVAVLSMLMDTCGSVLTRRHGVGLTPFDINAVRFGSASISLAFWQLYAARGNQSDTLTAAAGGDARHEMGVSGWIKVLLGILFCTCLSPTLNNISLFRLPLATAVTLGATGPLFALPITYFVRGERSSSRAAGGAAIAVAGVALLANSTPTA
eukprot:COSAG02_NODE_14_length_56855_cov_512.793661_43_plen_333_part_00